LADPLLDTNIFIRHFVHDYPNQWPRATALMMRIFDGDLRVRVTETIVFETVFTLESRYKRSKQEIRETLLPLLQLPGVMLPNKAMIAHAFDYYVDLNISYADAFHAVLMERLGIAEVISFDKHFDRVPGITRIEP